MSNIIEITDFNAPELDVYARISEIQLLNRAEPEKGIFIAESPKVIERALDSGCQPISFLVEHKHVEGEAKELIRRFDLAGKCDHQKYGIGIKELWQLDPSKHQPGLVRATERARKVGRRRSCENAFQRRQQQDRAGHALSRRNAPRGFRTRGCRPAPRC